MRPPWPELGLLAVGIASGMTARWLGVRSWATASAWVCIFTAIAALVTVALSSLKTSTNIVAFALGAAAAAWGVLWFLDHGDEPIFLSPIYVGYLGRGLATSALFTLIYRIIDMQRSERR